MATDVKHWFEKDGKRLHVTGLNSRGEPIALVTTWDTAENAELNWRKAFDGFIAVSDSIDATRNTRKSVRAILGRRLLVVSVAGPPTWWFPRVKLRLRPTVKVGFGWLRRGWFITSS